MRKYEAVFIFEPNMEEEVRNGLFDRFKGIIEANGTIDNIDEWGSRKLAYEIKDFKEGYYILVHFQAEADAVNEIDRVAKISDKVIRHMIIREEEK